MKKTIITILLFCPVIFAANSVSAQNVCSKKLDGKQVYVEIANMTNKAITVNLVDENCQETASTEKTPAMEIFSRILTNGQAFYIREDGSGKLLRRSFVNPSKPVLLVETELDGSNSTVRELDVVGDNDFKKCADAAFAALKSDAGSDGSTDLKLDEFKKHFIGT